MKRNFASFFVLVALFIQFALPPSSVFAAGKSTRLEKCIPLVEAINGQGVASADHAHPALLEGYQSGLPRKKATAIIETQDKIEQELAKRLNHIIEANAPPIHLGAFVDALPIGRQESFIHELIERNADDPKALSRIIAQINPSESSRRAIIKFLSESSLVTRPSQWYTTDEIRELFVTGRFQKFFPWAQPIVERRVFNYMRRVNPSFEEVIAFIKKQKANLSDDTIRRFLTTETRASAPQTVFTDVQIQTMFGGERFGRFFPNASKKHLGQQPQKELELALKTDPLAVAEKGLNRDWVNRPDTQKNSLIGILGFEPVTLPVQLQSQISNGFKVEGLKTPEEQLHGLIVQGAYAKDGHVLSPDLSLRRGMAQIERDAPRIMTLMKASLRDGALASATPIDQRLFVEAWELRSSGDLIRDIRQGALRAAELDPAFTQLRIEIHAFPNADVLRRTKEHFAAYKIRPDAKSKAIEEFTSLISQIETLLNVDKKGGVNDFIDGLPAGRDVRAVLSDLLAKERYTKLSSTDRLAVLEKMRSMWREGRLNSGAMTALYRYLSADRDLSSLAMREAAAAIEALPSDSGSQLPKSVALANGILKHVEQDNFLSPVQTQTVILAMNEIYQDRVMSDDRKLELLSSLLNNAVDQVYYLLRRNYGDYDEKMFHLVSAQAQVPPVHFVDSTLRSHNIFMLSQLVDKLESSQLERKNISHLIGDKETRISAQVFNPGEVIGRLRINADPMELSPEEIGVFSQMPTESGPLGGIITLGVGARLSHLQLLAKALGIPNVKFSPEALKELTKFDRKLVSFSAGKDGQVKIRPVTGDARTAIISNVPHVEVPIPDYRRSTPLRFGDGAAYDRYMIAGPKGMILMKLFRDPTLGHSVPDGFILPFGFYRRYLKMTGIAPMVDMLGKVDIQNTHLISELTGKIRQAFEENPVPKEMMGEIIGEMKALQGRTGHTGGYFFRSDTNIEDLPGFNGAGLNESIPNVPIDYAKVDKAVREVWASAFKEKSVYWRARALGAKTVPVADPSEVVLPTVYARSSGVILSKGTAQWVPGRGFISSNWGIGSVVEAGAFPHTDRFLYSDAIIQCKVLSV